MRFLIGNVVYEFKVQHDDDVVWPAISESNPCEFLLELKCRKFNLQSGAPHHYNLRFPRSGRDNSLSSLMSDVLEQFDVPSDLQYNITTHLQFYFDRLARRNPSQIGVIPVKAWLDVREISPEKAAGVQRRMEERDRNPPRAVARVAEVAVAPAERAAVEALSRERVSGGGEERECGICLEGMKEGEEIIRMPCFHGYHGGCILRWLERNHFCPYCKFKLPVEC